jgi:hypothetical protein
VQLPEEYIIQKFQAYCGGVKYLKYQNAYHGSCYICKEGNSWLKKKRSYYLPDDNIICCHNCGWYSKPYFWIKEITNLSYSEILKESQSFDLIPSIVEKQSSEIIKPFIADTLPHDSINLLDPSQVSFYKKHAAVNDTISFLQKRNLLTALYKPRALYLSLTDKIHKNRLIIPFYDNDNEIAFYQTRAIYDSDLQYKAKYISKVGGEKSLFNFNLIDENLDYMFILEGPINAFFCKNGVAVAGIQENSQNHFTPTQQRQLKRYPLHQKIWVLDSQWIDKASRIKSEILINQGERIFIWPESLGKKYKDFNDISMALKLNNIDYKFIINNSFSDLKAKMKLTLIKN